MSCQCPICTNRKMPWFGSYGRVPLLIVATIEWLEWRCPKWVRWSLIHRLTDWYTRYRSWDVCLKEAWDIFKRGTARTPEEYAASRERMAIAKAEWDAKLRKGADKQ